MPQYEPTLIKPDVYRKILPSLKNLDANVSEVREKLNGMGAEEWKRLHEFMIVRDTQSSLSLEGFKLDSNEVAVQYTACFVAGIPPESRKAMEGMFAAWNLLHRKFERGVPLDMELLLDTHNMVYHRINPEWAGKFRNGNVVRAGSSLTFPSYTDVPKYAKAIIDRINGSKDHPVVKALFAGYAFWSKQPFFDGNSRTSRLIQNMSLQRDGYPQAHVPENFQVQYEKQRELAGHGDTEGYYRFMIGMIEREAQNLRDFFHMDRFDSKKQSRSQSELGD